MRVFAALAVGLALSAPGAVSAAPNIRDLVEIAYLDSLSLSPDGRVAVVREARADVDSNGHDLIWWAVDANGVRPPVRVGAGGDAMFDGGMMKPEPVQWSADSRWFYFRALVDGAVQVWRARSDGTHTEQVTHDLADVYDFTLDPASLALTYRTGEPRDTILAAERAEYDDGIVVDYSIDVAQDAYRSMLINGRMATERLTGAWFSRSGLLGDRPLRVRRLAPDGRLEELPQGAPRPRQIELPPAPNPVNADGVTGLVNDADGNARPAVRSATGEETVCRHAGCAASSIAGLSWSANGRELRFSAKQADRSFVLMGWTPSSGRVRRIFVFPGSLGGGDYLHPGCAMTDKRALCVAAAASEPPRLIAIDLTAGTSETLLDPNSEARPRVAMRTEAMHWTDGGRDFHGVLFLPEGVAKGAPAPLFIQYYYCDGYLRGGTGDEYPMAVLAANGVASLCINSTRMKEVKPEEYDALTAYDVAVSGIRAAIEQLSRRGLVDPKRVGIGGLSFGSEVVMRSLVKSDLMRAAAISSGEIEPIYYWFNLRGRDFAERIRSTWKLGAPDETPERWKEVSAALSADSINAPLLMQLPEQESRYNYELMGRLSLRNVPVEMVIFPDEAHMKYQPRHKLAVYQRNLDWFRFWLADAVDPDPRKQAQYDRWRSMAATWRANASDADK